MTRLEERRKAEADFACDMVLKLVRELVRGHKIAMAGGLEPTCVPIYDDGMAAWVQQRSDRRP